jgi:branched-chain amino acid transport system substrate-binding protein
MPLSRRRLLSGLSALALIAWPGASWAARTRAGPALAIGLLANLTGSQDTLDKPLVNGARLKEAQLNAAGNRPQVELIVRDTQTDYAAMPDIASRLVHERGFSALIGYSDTDSVLAAAPAATRRGIPFVTPGATSPFLPRQLGGALFLACFGDNAQAAAGAEFLRGTLKARTVAMVTDRKSAYARILSRFFHDAFRHAGGAIAYEDHYRTGDRDFAALAGRLAALKQQPDALYIASQPEEIGLLIKACRAAGLNSPIVGGDGYDTPLLVQDAGAAADNVYFSTHVYLDPDGSPEVRQFIADYSAAYGEAPENAFAALGYDAVGLVADAARRADSTDYHEIQTALSATRHYKGVAGDIAYPPGGRVPRKSVAMVGIKEQRRYLAGTLMPVWVPRP